MLQGRRNDGAWRAGEDGLASTGAGVVAMEVAGSTSARAKKPRAKRTRPKRPGKRQGGKARHAQGAREKRRDDGDGDGGGAGGLTAPRP